MKCLYCLAPDVDRARRTAEHLRRAGVNERFLHIAGKKEHEIDDERLHTCNYLERLDVVRSGLIGIATGFTTGVIAAAVLMTFEAFGPSVPIHAYGILTLVFTLFGAWVGGLDGIARENKKLSNFHDALEDDKHLVMVYVPDRRAHAITKAVNREAPAVDLAAIDDHPLNPFSAVRYTGPGRWQSPGPERHDGGARLSAG
jgi:hypothetical protein